MNTIINIFYSIGQYIGVLSVPKNDIESNNNEISEVKEIKSDIDNKKEPIKNINNQQKYNNVIEEIKAKFKNN